MYIKNRKYTIFFRCSCKPVLPTTPGLKNWSFERFLQKQGPKALFGLNLNQFPDAGDATREKFNLKLKGFLKLFQFFLPFPKSIFIAYSNLQIFLRDSILILNQAFTSKQLVDVK